MSENNAEKQLTWPYPSIDPSFRLSDKQNFRIARVACDVDDCLRELPRYEDRMVCLQRVARGILGAAPVRRRPLLVRLLLDHLLMRYRKAFAIASETWDQDLAELRGRDK